MDLDGPGRDVQAGRESPYPEEFRKDAVALHRAAPGERTYAAVAAELGITAESLRTWVRKDDCWDFISDNRARSGAQRICRVLGVSRSGYHRHLAIAQARAERQAEEKRTVSEIRAVHVEHHGAYGAPRIHAEPRARGRRINHIVGRHLRKKKRTTIADHTAPPAPDLVTRDFTTDTLDTRWCGDITYMAVGAKWLYLATVIDICSRKVVGWSIAGHMRTSLVTDAIEMAVAARGGRVHGVVFHTDRGAQYSATAFAEVCRRHGIRRGMGRVGSSCSAGPYTTATRTTRTSPSPARSTPRSSQTGQPA